MMLAAGVCLPGVPRTLSRHCFFSLSPSLCDPAATPPSLRPSGVAQNVYLSLLPHSLSFVPLHPPPPASLGLPGVPPVLAAMSLAYNVNLFGSITHYASGQAAVYCGSGFVRITEVFKFGALNGAMSLIICE